MKRSRVLIVDHRDSFVHILGDALASHGCQLDILRSAVSLRQLEAVIDAMQPELLVLSPGPGHPRDAGIMLPFLASDPVVPILGVCLGHQALALAAGGTVSTSGSAVHGKSSPILHNGDPLFRGIPSPFRAGRYHSLRVEDVPSCYTVIAHHAEAPQIVMAIRHRTRPRIGLQFHPESVLTPLGKQLLGNILDEASRKSTESTD